MAEAAKLMAGKRGVVFGVANNRSIAWGITKAVTYQGAEVALTYLRLGVEHILFGVDHLLFVLALLILVHGWKQIVLTISAFTLAHSITLTAATLGFVHVPGPPVDAAVALSIVLVAVEIVQARRGRPLR